MKNADILAPSTSSTSSSSPKRPSPEPAILNSNYSIANRVGSSGNLSDKARRRTATTDELLYPLTSASSTSSISSVSSIRTITLDTVPELEAAGNGNGSRTRECSPDRDLIDRLPHIPDPIPDRSMPPPPKVPPKPSAVAVAASLAAKLQNLEKAEAANLPPPPLPANAELESPIIWRIPAPPGSAPTIRKNISASTLPAPGSTNTLPASLHHSGSTSRLSASDWRSSLRRPHPANQRPPVETPPIILPANQPQPFTRGHPHRNTIASSVMSRSTGATTDEG